MSMYDSYFKMNFVNTFGLSHYEVIMEGNKKYNV